MKKKERSGGEKNILNEKAEPCDQHKICFKQDILNYNRKTIIKNVKYLFLKNLNEIYT